MCCTPARREAVHADIVILDQHLDFEGGATILGTDLVAELLQANFAGLICIRSANVAEHDLARYAAAGAHCMFGKDMLMREMLKQMKAAYVRHILKGVSFRGLAPQLWQPGLVRGRAPPRPPLPCSWKPLSIAQAREDREQHIGPMEQLPACHTRKALRRR